MNEIIKKYSDFYQDKNHSFVADMIMESEEVSLSHRSLRAKVSEYRKSQESNTECCTRYLTCENQECIPKKEFIESEGKIEYNKPTWNQEDTVDYFRNQERSDYDWDTSHMNQDQLKTYIVMGCIHFPFHNKPFWNATLKFIKELVEQGKLHGVVLNGDILDMNSISRHNKNKVGIAGLTLEEEYRLASVELTKLNQVLGFGIEKHYLYGNHEMWYSQYMQEADSSKLGRGVVKSPTEALKLKENGYLVQEDYKNAFLILGDTEVHHGTYVTKHAANKHAESMRRSNVFNHTHRIGSYIEGNIMSYNLGWMGDKTQPVFGYMDRIQKETWANGFGLIHIDSDNKSHVEQITWKNNRFIYSGKVYK